MCVRMQVSPAFVVAQFRSSEYVALKVGSTANFCLMRDDNEYSKPFFCRDIHRPIP